MSPSSIAGVITACAAVFTALGGLVLAVTVLIPMLRTGKSTHEIVNQQRTDMQRYIRALTRSLKEAGVELPVDQSVEDDAKA